MLRRLCEQSGPRFLDDMPSFWALVGETLRDARAIEHSTPISEEISKGTVTALLAWQIVSYSCSSHMF